MCDHESDGPDPPPEHQVSMYVMRVNARSTAPAYERGAKCEACGARVVNVFDDPDGRVDDAATVALLQALLSQVGCEHWRVPFVDHGQLFDPRVERRRSLSGDGWTGEVYGFLPTAGAGTVDGYPWAYRAIYGGWEFAVAATPDGDPVDVIYGLATGYRAEGDDGTGVPEACAIVEHHIATYRATHATPPVEPHT